MTLAYSIFDIFMVMYLGNEMMLSSDALSQCVYESNWIDQTESCKKCIIILTERLKRPQQIIVSKLYPLSLLTFTSVCFFFTLTRKSLDLISFLYKRLLTVPTACSIFCKTFAEGIIEW